MTVYYIQIPLATIQSIAGEYGYTLTANGVSFPGETLLFSSYGVGGTVDVDIVAQSAYNQANLSYELAQAAYEQANTGTGIIANVDVKATFERSGQAHTGTGEVFGCATAKDSERIALVDKVGGHTIGTREAFSTGIGHLDIGIQFRVLDIKSF